jgi:predicted glutamine amidotransferase
MCELPGANANTPTDVKFSFADLARRADEYADGFGMAFAESHSGWPRVEPQSVTAAPVA